MKISLLVNKLKNFVGKGDQKNLFSNIGSLIILQVVNMVLPLVTMPYLVRVLGADRFGLVMFAHAFALYFNIITDFGFNLSATRAIATNKNNWDIISEVYNSVMIAKAVLFLISLSMGYFVIVSFTRFNEESTLFFLSFGIVFGQALFPIWFFQGIEKMKNITILNVIAKVIFTIGIFVFVKSPDDYLLIPILNSVGFIFAGIGAIYIISSTYQVRYYLPTLKTVWAYFKESSHFFLSRLSFSVFTISNSFILGLTTTNTNVAYYSIAEKLYTAMQSVFYPITQGLYPYVADKRDVPLFKKILKYVLAFNTVTIVIVFVLAPFIIKLVFGEGMENSILVFRILLVALLFSVPSMFLGFPFTAALGKTSIANYSVVTGAILHLSVMLGLYLMNLISISSVAMAVVLTEVFILSYRYIGAMKFDLWNIKPKEIEI